MPRLSFKLTIRPGSQEEYRSRHKKVYPELLQAFREVGIHTYSIYMHGTTLYAYMEVRDFESAMEQLDAHPANIKWQEMMSDILIPNEKGEIMESLPEVFHFESF